METSTNTSAGPANLLLRLYPKEGSPKANGQMTAQGRFDLSRPCWLNSELSGGFAAARAADALVNFRYLKTEATRSAMDRNGSEKLRARIPIIARSKIGRSWRRWRRNPASLTMPPADTVLICQGSIGV